MDAEEVRNLVPAEFRAHVYGEEFACQPPFLVTKTGVYMRMEWDPFDLADIGAFSIWMNGRWEPCDDHVWGDLRKLWAMSKSMDQDPEVWAAEAEAQKLEEQQC